MELKVISLTKNALNIIRNPLSLFFFLTAFSNQGIIIQASFYFFEINEISIEIFGLMFLGLITAFIFGFLFGFDFTKSKTKYMLLLFGSFHSLLLLFLTFTFNSNINNSILIYLFLGIFGGFLALFTLVRSIMVADDENRIKMCSKIVFVWFFGQALFGLIFFINIEGAIFLSFISSSLGTFALYRLMNEETEVDPISFQKITLREVFTPNNLSLVILFSIYGLILFSYIQLFANQVFPTFSSFPGTIMGTILVGVIFAAFTSIIIYLLNLNVSLKSTYSLIYIVVSLSLFILLLDQNTIIIAFFLSISIWSFFASYIFSTFGDIYPKSQYLQLFSFWWLSLTLSFGGGILLPLIITNQLHVLYFHLFLVLFSIFLLTYLSSLSTPLMVYYITIFTPAGIPIYSKGYLELDKALVTGLLTGIMTMFKEVFESGSNLQSIDHGDKKLIITKTEMLFGVLLINHVESQAIDKLQEITEMFEVSFHSSLEKEPQRVSVFENLPSLLEKKINFFEKN
ncbi:MAG: hypothetical protein ACW981_21195 [Candidatus Hodarchaeales archaeon]